MNYELQDWEMSFKDMFFSVLYKWKQILVIAVVIALALGGMQAFKTRESNIANKASYEGKLASYERSLAIAQDSYDYANQMVENQKRYLQESTLMQINAYNAYEAKISLYISTGYQIMPEMKYQNEDPSESLVAIYKNVITDNDVLAQVSEELGMENKHLKELITTAQPSDHVLAFAVSHTDAEIAEKAAHLIMEHLEKTKPVATKIIGEHSLEVVLDSVGPYVDVSKAIEKREKQEALLVEYEEELAAQKTALSKVQKTKPTKYGSSVVKTAILWCIIGGVAGVALCAVACCVYFIFRTTVYSADELRGRMGVRCLGSVTRGKRFDFITRALRRVEGRVVEDSEGNAAVIAQTLCNYTGENKCVLVSGSGDRAYTEKLVERLQNELADLKLVAAGGLLRDADAASGLRQCDAVLLVEVCGKTKYKTIGQERERIQDAGKPFLGCVLVDG